VSEHYCSVSVHIKTGKGQLSSVQVEVEIMLSGMNCTVRRTQSSTATARKSFNKIVSLDVSHKFIVLKLSLCVL